MELRWLAQWSICSNFLPVIREKIEICKFCAEQGFLPWDDVEVILVGPVTKWLVRLMSPIFCEHIL
jgi:hypothetical protein